MTLKHLSAEEFVDCVESEPSAVQAAHLEQCVSCRRRVVDLHAMLEVTRANEVPEPSPLFWDRLSERIRAAVAVEPIGRGRGAWPLWSRWGVFPLALATVGIVLAVGAIVRGPHRLEQPENPTAQPATALPSGAAVEAGDASWKLMADLSATLDDQRTEEALDLRPGTVDEAVFHLSDLERDELARLIRVELGRPGS